MDTILAAAVGLIIDLYIDQSRGDHGVAARIVYVEGNSANSRAER